MARDRPVPPAPDPRTVARVLVARVEPVLVVPVAHAPADSVVRVRVGRAAHSVRVPADPEVALVVPAAVREAPVVEVVPAAARGPVVVVAHREVEAVVDVVERKNSSHR